MNDYRNDSDNTVGTGSTIKAIAIIGEGKTIKETEIETSHSNMVSARWIFKRELENWPKEQLHCVIILCQNLML